MIRESTAGIVLAAGMSARLGRPKQLLHVGGRFLLHRVLETALESKLDRVVLVLGHEAGRIMETLGLFLLNSRFQVAINERYGEGMASSLQAGLMMLKDQCPSVMFLLGDQPLVDPATIDGLLERFRTSDKEICLPVFQGRRGNPAIFASPLYESILALRGDTGGREIIDRNPDRVLAVEMKDPLLFSDVDTEEDLHRVAMEIARRRG